LVFSLSRTGAVSAYQVGQKRWGPLTPEALELLNNVQRREDENNGEQENVEENEDEEDESM